MALSDGAFHICSHNIYDKYTIMWEGQGNLFGAKHLHTN